MSKKNSYSEIEVVRMLQNRFGGGGRGLVKGIGDDCAVIRIPSGMELLVTTDSLMEGIHFRSNYER